MADFKVLVADDDEALRQLVMATLLDERLAFLEAADGEHALALAQRELPHLILLDMVMPRLSGGEICKVLRDNAATRSIPIIMLTGLGRPSDREFALRLGADVYLTKPFSPLQLLQLAEHYLQTAAFRSAPSAAQPR